METIRVLTTEPLALKTNRYGADSEAWRVTYDDGTVAYVTERNGWIELRIDGQFRTQLLTDSRTVSPHIHAYKEC